MESVAHASSLAAVERFLGVVASRDLEAYLDAFVEGAVYEVTFFDLRFDGRDAIAPFVGPLLAVMQGLEFHDIVLQSLLDPNRVIAQYRGSALITTTGRSYDQTYISVFEVQGDKIRSYQEYVNTRVSAYAFGRE